jgi:hypothetical protein
MIWKMYYNARGEWTQAKLDFIHSLSATNRVSSLKSFTFTFIFTSIGRLLGIIATVGFHICVDFMRFLLSLKIRV